ncbi:MAG: type IV secretion system protein, partial [Patescibacteria group bacterium]|nr:type IV secretion system protein [Patescibacteria group bacterium]
MIFGNKKNKLFSLSTKLIGILFCLGLIFGGVPQSVIDYAPAWADNSKVVELVAIQPAAAEETEDGDSGGTELPNFISRFIGLVASLLIRLEGAILGLLTEILMWLMSYQDFIKSAAVNKGWNLVRDISNMFFVVVLLVIAIATILRIESYNLKRLLPKVILMAVLVNFSRLICGFIIQTAQVVMMTFAAAFVATTSGEDALGNSRLIGMFQVDKMLNAAANIAANSETMEIGIVAISSLFAVILLLIAIAVVFVMLVVIMMRIVMLWLLIVLSPLTFILSAFPQGESYARQWWQNFTKYVIIGPVLAFFLWLAFAVASSSTGAQGAGRIDPVEQGLIPANASDKLTQITSDTRIAGSEDNQNKHIFTAIGDATNLTSFIIAIGLLMGSLMVTQQIGVAGGTMAGNLYSQIRQKGARAPLAMLKKGGQLAGWAERKVYSGEIPWAGKYTKGISLNPVRWYNQYKGYMDQRRKDQEAIGQAGAGFKYAEALGKERKGPFAGTRGVIGRPANAIRLLLGSPGDFMKYYGGLRGISEMGKTITGREHPGSILPQFLTGMSNEEVAVGRKRSSLYDEYHSGMQEVASERQALKDRLDSGEINQEQFDKDSQLIDQVEQARTKDFQVRDAELKGEQMKVRTKRAVTPLPYEAMAQFRSLVNEEIRRLPESMEWTEIEGQMDIAKRNGDQARFIALMTKAAKDYNDNEWLNHYGYSAAAYGGKMWEGANGQNKKGHKGVKEFADEVLVGELGLNQQFAYSILNDIAYINEDRKHGGTSRMFQVKDGRFEMNDRISQAASYQNEWFKGNIRALLQNSNRLDSGGENVEGGYDMAFHAAMRLAAVPDQINNFLSRQEFNPSTRSKWQSDTESLDVLEAMEFIQNPDDENGRSYMTQGIVDLIRHPEKAQGSLNKEYRNVVATDATSLENWAKSATEKAMPQLAAEIERIKSTEEGAKLYKQDPRAVARQAAQNVAKANGLTFVESRRPHVKEDGGTVMEAEGPEYQSDEKTRAAVATADPSNPDAEAAQAAQDHLDEAGPAKTATAAQEALRDRATNLESFKGQEPSDEVNS